MSTPPKKKTPKPSSSRKIKVGDTIGKTTITEIQSEPKQLETVQIDLDVIKQITDAGSHMVPRPRRETDYFSKYMMFLQTINPLILVLNAVGILLGFGRLLFFGCEGCQTSPTLPPPEHKTTIKKEK